jgi:dinuclear metal center YbgI/SA1388 family protein
MKIKDLENVLEKWAPLSLQEDYDNSGLLVGDRNKDISSVLVSLDVTEDVIMEAIKKKANVIVSHHPIIFKTLRSLTGRNEVERCVELAVKNEVALYAIHTNLDKISGGVSFALGNALGLLNMKILSQDISKMYHLVTHVPKDFSEAVSESLFNAGAGKLGNYDQSKFVVSGKGSFRPLESSRPFKGEIGKLEELDEDRIEVLVAPEFKYEVESALFETHPYEEISYAWIELSNFDTNKGFGAIGDLPVEHSEEEFTKKMKKILNLKSFRHTKSRNGMIKKVAVCGGSGVKLLSDAITANCDAFLTSDISYHTFFDAKKRIFLADIGHWESEQHTIDLIADYIRSKMTNFAVTKTESNTNPIIIS